MSKIIAVWSETIESVPSDNKIEEWLTDVITGFNKIKDVPEAIYYLYIASSTQTDILRLAVARKLISCDELEFQYKDETISVHTEGTLSHWPEGFSDFSDKQLEELLLAKGM